LPKNSLPDVDVIDVNYSGNKLHSRVPVPRAPPHHSPVADTLALNWIKPILFRPRARMIRVHKIAPGTFFGMLAEQLHQGLVLTRTF
jgi:hypothetical protein